MDVELLPRYISDHNPVISIFNYGGIKNKFSRWRFNSSLLKNEEFLTQLKSGLEEFIKLNKDSISDKTMVWALVKEFIRNIAIMFSSHLKKYRLLKISTLEEECKTLESDLKESNITTENHLKTKQAELNDLLMRRAEYMIHVTKHKYYAEGSRPSHLLALTLKQQEAKRNIPAIRCTKRGMVTSTEEITETFKDFYKDLYTGGPQPSENDLSNFFSGLDLPLLSEEDTQELDSAITLEEFLKAVKSTNKGRTPGIDGIPVELYLALWDVLNKVFFTGI